VIRQATVVDGTGSAAVVADVAVRGGRIAAIGTIEPAHGERTYEARGLVLAPGFIDPHSHHDDGLREHPAALAAVSQGITTVVVGVDGESELPLADWFANLERTPVALNVASFAGHGALRRAAMGSDYRRTARPEEIDRMRALLALDMHAGALGLSTGLEYDPGIYANTAELVQLARVAARKGGIYASHMRSEDIAIDAALDEVAAIAREARIPAHISHISHLKLALIDRWGEAPKLLERLDHWRTQGLNITADAYPYTYWHSGLTVLFPERDFSDLDAARHVLAHTTPADGLILTRYAPEPGYVGKSLTAIAAARRTSAAQALLDLIRMAYPDGNIDVEDERESIIGTSMREDDVAAFLAWPYTSLCSDGALDGGHPRGFGAFTRYLRRYGINANPASLAGAVHRMTGLTAEQMGLADRGRIAQGLPADLVLFDPVAVRDRATIERPHEVSAGIRAVWVNGELVWDGTQTTAARPGQVLRRRATR
jgi:N-acyl-D-amino-acid deacylase